jgi:2',3'-cyclic-nucleotide 2'-phosphodiesterase (5'-nucleotidase family)
VRLARAALERGSGLPALPLIIGGHSHTFLPRGQTVGDTLIAQAGQKAQVLGRVDLWIERESGRVSGARAELIELPAAPAALAAAEERNPALAALCRELVRESGAAWTRVVGRLSAPLERTREPRSSSAGNLVADMLREHAAADVGLHNKGGLRRDLPAGDVRARDVFELLPFDNTVVVLELDGAELEGLLRHAVDGRRNLSIELSGMTLELALQDGRLRIAELRVGGEPPQRERTYRLATNSFLARGGDDVVPPALRGRGQDGGVLLRDALQTAFEKHGVLAPSSENRVVVRRER